jgi:tRNA-dihydrouridine synthase
VVSRHLDLMESYFAPPEAVLQMKKHLMYYSRTWAGARLLRGELFDLKTAARVREVFSKRVRPIGEPAAR